MNQTSERDDASARRLTELMREVAAHTVVTREAPALRSYTVNTRSLRARPLVRLGVGAAAVAACVGAVVVVNREESGPSLTTATTTTAASAGVPIGGSGFDVALVPYGMSFGGEPNWIGYTDGTSALRITVGAPQQDASGDPFPLAPNLNGSITRDGDRFVLTWHNYGQDFRIDGFGVSDANLVRTALGVVPESLLANPPEAVLLPTVPSSSDFTPAAYPDGDGSIGWIANVILNSADYRVSAGPKLGTNESVAVGAGEPITDADGHLVAILGSGGVPLREAVGRGLIGVAASPDLTFNGPVPSRIPVPEAKTITLMNRLRAFLVDTPSGPVALSWKDPGDGCRLTTWRASQLFSTVDGVVASVPASWTAEDGSAFVDPCHGAHYDIAGQRVSGPVSGSMFSLPLEVDAGSVVLTQAMVDELLDRPVDAESHGLWAWPSSKAAADSLAAPVVGVLRIDVGHRCLLLEWPDHNRYPVVWPIGTTFSASHDRVVLVDGTEISDGQSVSGAGGAMTVDDVRQAVGILMEVPAACAAATGEVLVFNATETVTVK